MSDKKLTDEEIIKALEDYIKENEFEYFHSNTVGEYPLIRKSLDLINRQKSEIERLKGSTIVNNIMEIQRIKREIKAATVCDMKDVKHGEWIYVDGDVGYNVYRCSKCGKVISLDEEKIYNYCPNCGAKMGGERKEGD